MALHLHHVDTPPPRDSIEWLDMMAQFGPLDCRPMFARIAEELRQLRQHRSAA